MSEALDPINLDLDAVEAPEEVTKTQNKPFRVNWKGGRVVEMVNPRELDWQDIIEVEDPVSLLTVALKPEDREYVEETPLPSWKLQIVFEQYMAFYGLSGGKTRKGLLSKS